MNIYKTNNETARCFILHKQGLIGAPRFVGKKGIVDFVKQAGCIQFDPLDICGRNADLVLQARIPSYDKNMLDELLYTDRILYDHFDKNLAILRVEDWPHFSDIRDHYRTHGKNLEAIGPHIPEIIDDIRRRGPLCSKDLSYDHKIDWYWNATNLSRAALETLYFRGDLIIHHKNGTIKYYDLSERHIPEIYLREQASVSNRVEHHQWHVKRRISAVGMLWNRPSDAFLNIMDFKAVDRQAAFKSLEDSGEIVGVEVEGIQERLFIIKEDIPLLESIMTKHVYDDEHDEDNDVEADRIKFIAPLDSFIWDRKLIKNLFGFDYKWEVYTPIKDRKYGHYTLPMLYGTKFIGRIECVCNRKEKVLIVKNVWWEESIGNDISKFEEPLKDNLDRFAVFNGCVTWR